MGSPIGEVAMVSQGLVEWGCASLVVVSGLWYISYEVFKRWTVGLRLTALDESLLDEGFVAGETLTDAPEGSHIVEGLPAEIISND